ncbi:hypothetical protein HYT45_04455 [Candidatus Uhrbacteria bacterium]|nr:hypothetical protein [Candidatus Uhrbacteria bacterium]
MSSVLIALMTITALFAALFLLTAITRLKLCVICASISLTWIILLVFYRLGYFENPLFIALLMGQTAVGIYYLLERRVKEELLVFRLPFLLSVTVAAFALLGGGFGGKYAIGFLALLWLAAGGAYALRNKEKAKNAIKLLISCCRNW